MNSSDEITLHLKIRCSPDDLDALQNLLASNSGRDHLANWLGWILEQAVALARVPWTHKNRNYDVTVTSADTALSHRDT